MPNGERVEKFRENAEFTKQDVFKHLKTVTDVKVLQADGLLPGLNSLRSTVWKSRKFSATHF